MGIFDGWQYDPQTYQKPPGGLFDQIMAMQQMVPQAPTSFGGTQQQANAFPPISGSQPGPTDVVGSLGSSIPVPTFGQPNPAQLPQNAQPAQYQPPQAAPQDQSPNFGDRLSGALGGFSNGIQTGLISALRGGVEGANSGSAPQNQTVKALEARGLDPAIARQVARDPASMRALLPTLLGNTGQTDDIKEYNFAKKEDPSLTFAKFMQQKKAVSGEYSLTPQYGVNDKGETVLIQTGKSGAAIQTKLPDNVKISSGTDKIDLGTQWAIINKRDGSIIGYQPKDVAGAASQKAQGAAQGEATVALPAAIQQAEDALKTIQQAKNHPGKQYGLGIYGMFPAVPNTDQAGFVSLVDQMQGRAFLQAYQSLKGTGSISEAEGAKAEAAVARLKRTQKPEDFNAALADLEDIVRRGVETARAKAKQSGGPIGAAPSSAPARVKTYNPATGKIE